MKLEKELTPRVRQADLPDLDRLAKLYAGDKTVQKFVATERKRRKFGAEQKSEKTTGKTAKSYAK